MKAINHLFIWIAIAFLFLPLLSSADYSRVDCIDSRTLNTTIVIKINKNDGIVNENQLCDVGCNNATKQCSPVSAQVNSPGIPLNIFIFLEAIAVITFFISFTNMFNLEKESREVMTIMSIILFLMMAFFSFQVQLGIDSVVYIIPMVV